MTDIFKNKTIYSEDNDSGSEITPNFTPVKEIPKFDIDSSTQIKTEYEKDRNF